MSLRAGVRRLAIGLARLPLIASAIERPAVQRVLTAMPGGRQLYPQGWDRRHPFDRRHGTDTSGTVAEARLSEDPETVAHAVFYAGSQPSVMRRAFAALPDVRGATFLDLGCGKGRGLLVASEWPFARIIGIDISAALVDIARRNVAIVERQFPGRPPIELVVGDASRCALPPGDLVIYLYHPFDATLMAGVAAGIEAALAAEPRRLFVVYCNPVAGRCFDASPRLRRRFAATIPYSQEDLGCGPDESDPVIIWQGGTAPAPPADPSLDVEIVVAPPRRRARLQPRRTT